MDDEVEDDDDVKGEEDDVDAEDKEENDDVEEENQSQDREAHFVRACAGEMRMDISRRTIAHGICRKMAADTSGDIVLCEPAHSKCAWTFHKRHFALILQEKWPRRPPGTSFCASLRSRNARGHVTRGILYGKLQ